MFYREIPPALHLRDLVKCYWVLQSGGADGVRHAERILPDGCVEVVFNFSDPFHHLRDNQAAASQPAALAVGQMRAHMLIQPGRAIDLFAIRFRPGGAFPFFGFPLRALTDVADDLTLLHDPEFATMLSALAEAPDTGARVDTVEHTLTRRASRHGPRDVLVGAALDLLREAQVSRPIAGLADQLGVGARQLERRFDRAVGLPPKVISRIFRFHRLLRTLQAPLGTTPAARPAHGYYDESHLLRDFKAFTGQTPADYAIDWHALSDQFIGQP